ncbi:MAG: transporter, partial [Verrucomicrobia bacterium]|nr:transporter [Verrucomicrobiota bacterium]
YIQQFQGYIWPGVVAVFVFGLLVPTAPGSAGVAGMVSGPVLYGLLQLFAKDLHFLIQGPIVFQLVLLIMGLITLWFPRAEPKLLPVRADLDVTTSPVVKWAGGAVLVGVAIFYAVFW